MNINGALYTLSQQQVIITPGTVYGIKYIIIVFCSLDILNNIHLIHVPKEAFVTKSQLPLFQNFKVSPRLQPIVECVLCIYA